jgi:uncharacterized protein YfaS (alpha-2-macroglobulin family)
MAIFQRGETIILQISIRNEGILVDPSEAPKVTAYDPAGEAAIEDEEMVQVDTGIYSYDHQTDGDSLTGWYPVRYTVEDSGRITIEDDGFEVKE